jgi:hypothetical protein
LLIQSNGAVKLSQVTANSNSNSGVYVDNYSNNVPDLHPQPVTVTGFLNALDNNGSGLEIYSKGVVTLTNLTTSHNSTYGTYIDNKSGTLPMAVNITGTNAFNDNYGYNGLYIASLGAITLNNVTAIYNGIDNDKQGAYIYNKYDSAKPQNITLNGYNFFRHNANDGLTVISYGAITVNNVTAIDNGNTVDNTAGAGVRLDNSDALLTKPAAITIKGVNLFTSNDEYGLVVSSKGAITVSNITADSNGDDGAHLDNSGGSTGAVTLTGNNVFSFNGSDGLQVGSKGTITLNNITSYQNGDDGAYLNNQYGTAQYGIFVNGYGLFDWNTNDGLQAYSNGAITTNNLNANHNSGNGTILNAIGILKPQTVTLKGTNNFHYNGNATNESGLFIQADGAITVNNVTADHNYSNGAYLDNFTNWDSPAVNFATFGSVTITGFGNFTGNGNAGSTLNGLQRRNEGLYIYTHGAATLTNVSANFNSLNDGIGIDADGNVTVSCSSANNNAYGFWMYGTPVPVLTLKGLITAGNTVSPESFNSPIVLVRTRCP